MGRALYEALEDALGRMGILSAYACVACPNPDDEHLTDISSRFHERMGYAKIGEFADCGNKFGQWYDIAWMKKDLAPHEPDPNPVTPFCKLVWGKFARYRAPSQPLEVLKAVPQGRSPKFGLHGSGFLGPEVHSADGR